MSELRARLEQLIRLAIRFAMVGLASVGVYFVFLALLRPMIADTVILTGTAYVASAVFNYLAQSLFTFRARAADAGSVGRYMVMHGLCMAINSGLMHVLVDRLGMNLWLAQIGVTGVVAATSFTLSYLWVYRRQGQGRGL